MFGSEILEVGIGIIFVFMLVSMICSTIREGIEAWFKTRAAYLEFGIRELLHDRNANGIAKSLYEHPLISGIFLRQYKADVNTKKPGMFANGKNLPSYIPSKNFALALLDIAARGPETDEVSSDPQSPKLTLENARLNIQNIRNVAVQRVLLTAIDTAEGDLNVAVQNIGNWYDSSMDRVSGWYKRSTHWINFWVGLALAIALNINAITIADYLYTNDTARSIIVKQAEKAASDTNYLAKNFTESKQALQELKLPIGWSQGWGVSYRKADSGGFWNNALAPILGWLITAFAATMGASFWFDLLNKVMVIRSTVKPAEKSPEEGSEDRQLPKAPVIKAEAELHRPVIAGGVAAIHGPVDNPGVLEVPTPRDEESSVDGCDVEMDDFTSDEDLPPSEGGVG